MVPPPNRTLYALRSVRIKLALLSYTCPDLLFQVSQVMQLNPERFREQIKSLIRTCNRAINIAKSIPGAILSRKLEIDSLHLVGSLMPPLITAMTSLPSWYICCFAETPTSGSYRCCSNPTDRVTRSVLGSELIAFSDLFDAAYSFSAEVALLLGKEKWPITLRTDSKSPFDIIYKGKRRDEKRLMMDLACAREGYHTHEICDYVDFPQKIIWLLR